jgi:hypothetical protein
MSAQAAYLVNAVLLPFAVAVMFVGSLVGIAVGLGLIASSARTIGFLSSLNRWVSTRKVLEPLEAPRDLGWLVNRFRRPIGALFALAGAYTLISMASWPGVSRFQALFGLKVSSLSASAVLLESAFWVLVFGSVFVLVTGFLLCFFPEAIGAMEARVNRWVSTRRLAEGADKMRLPLDRMVEAYPRAAGWIIVIASSVAALGTGPLLLAIR